LYSTKVVHWEYYCQQMRDKLILHTQRSVCLCQDNSIIQYSVCFLSSGDAPKRPNVSEWYPRPLHLRVMC
jgi:hypothetical protein